MWAHCSHRVAVGRGKAQQFGSKSRAQANTRLSISGWTVSRQWFTAIEHGHLPGKIGVISVTAIAVHAHVDRVDFPATFRFLPDGYTISRLRE